MYPETTETDVFFNLLGYISHYLTNNFYIFNLILSTILVFAINVFAKNLKQHFIALLISFPYIFIVVGMGFVRQGLAFSLILIALNYFFKNKDIYFYIFLILAVLSHKSAGVLFFLPLLRQNTNFFINIIFFIFFGFSLYYLIDHDLKRLIYYYLGKGQYLESLGAIFRNFFGLIPVLIYFIFFKQFNLHINSREKIVYLIFSIILILLFFLSFYASTFADRIAIYFFPFYLFIFSNLAFIFQKKFRNIINFSILLLFNAYLIFWFNFGQFSHVWTPYKNIVIEYFFFFPVQ